MDCAQVVFSGHAIVRMFERGIGRDEVLAVVKRSRNILRPGPMEANCSLGL